MEKPYFARFGQKSLDSFAPLLIRLKRVQDEMHSVLGAEAQPIIDKVTASQALSQDDVNNCHDLLGDLVDNESEPETGYSGLGTGAGVFSINVMNFGDVVYGISDLEFDDIGYFGSREEAEEDVRVRIHPFEAFSLSRFRTRFSFFNGRADIAIISIPRNGEGNRAVRISMTENLSEADTGRKLVVPKLVAAGWDSEPHSIGEPRTAKHNRRSDYSGWKEVRSQGAKEGRLSAALYS